MSNKIGFLQDIYNKGHSMNQLADSKAGMALSIQSIILGIGIGSSILSKTFNILFNDANDLTSSLYLTLLFITILSFIIGLLFIFFTFNPRLDTHIQKNGLIYFEHIISKEPEEYKKSIKSLSDDIIIEEYIDQIIEISHISSKKMKCVKGTILTTIITLVLSFGFMISTILLLITYGGD